ncbi:sensor histidine kinase [Bacillus sinesaloumensis]|uniref:sensor histidine kinase n=1 Tax=Litchfieldia sinesaloumensis TaxID=1926280 RepID=UPI000988667C|nr:histidine kinase [Bacillus sinesaloumensis]
MIKIRTKLLIYFATILFLIVLLFFVRDQSNQRIMELNNENDAYLFLLNEIAKKTNQTFDALQIYVNEPLQENLSVYQENKEQIIQLQQRFYEIENESIAKKNYVNLMVSFLEQTEKTVDAVDKQDIESYSLLINEANKTSTYIYEETLDLINNELSHYHELSKLMGKKISSMKKMNITILIGIILLSVIFAIWFSNGITRTIEKLTRAAQEISARRYTGEDVVVSRKDELWFLTKTFNEMKRNILESMSEIEEKAKMAQLLKEMELKSLQNQINPHFLFNTLNTISKTSFIEGAEKTSDLIASISALLRYNIGSLDRQTLLKDEVDIIREYFFIQQSRFGDRVEFIENIDPNCLSISIPCLTLQPIVENAFIHGIEGMAEGARIELIIYEDNDFVCIEVRDNGVGMDLETQQRLMNVDDNIEANVPKKGTGHSTGIGMRNVISRLSLFQKESKVEVVSKIGEGTTVRIRLKKTNG